MPAAAPEIAEGSFAEQRGRIITVSAVREQRDDHFSFVFRPLREFDRAVKRSAGRNSYRDSLFMGKELSRLKSSLIGSLEDLIINLCVEDIRHKSCADSLDLMGSALSFGQDR